MACETKRLTTKCLNTLFVNSLSSAVLSYSDLSIKPLTVELCKPYPINIKLRVYLFNCTNPPGGRSPDEYKSQIIVPGQLRGCRGQLDFSGDCIVLLGAYAIIGDSMEDGIFVFWDALKHQSFAYSTNIQVKADLLYEALVSHVGSASRVNTEVVYASRPQYLLDAIRKRIETA